MVDMGSVGETAIVVEKGGLRDLKVIWRVVGANRKAKPTYRQRETVRGTRENAKRERD